MHWKNTLTVFVAGMVSASLVYNTVNLTTMADDQQASKHSADKTVSYSLGWEMGKEALQNLDFDGVSVDASQMAAGFKAALSGDDPAYDAHQMNLALIEFNDEVFDRVHHDRMQNDPVYQAQAISNAKAGAEYRARFAGLPNIKSTESGALYRVDKAGDGPSPKIGDFIVASYRVLLLDGTEIGEEDNATIDTRTMLKFGQELIQLMRVGDKWTVLIAPKANDGRASRGFGGGPNEALIAEIELHGITDHPDE
jgi:FKBP-type peptidyl-prolyl cis-trans isomerase FkpA